MKKYRRKLYSLVYAVMATMVVGCSGSKEVNQNDPAEILSLLDKSYQTTPDLTLKGKMKISGLPVTIWFESLVRRQDSLKILLKGPFGIDVGGLSATPNSFTYLDLQESIVYEGVPNRETFRKLIQMNVAYDEIVSLLRAEVPNLPDPSQVESGSVTASIEKGDIRYTTTSANSVETFVVDPDKLVVKEYKRMIESGGKMTTPISASYSDFIKIGGRYFAEEAVATLSDGEQTLRITMDNIKTSIDDDARFTIDIPAGMTRKKM